MKALGDFSKKMGQPWGAVANSWLTGRFRAYISIVIYAGIDRKAVQLKGAEEKTWFSDL